MTTEQRTRPSADDLERSAVVNVSSAGNRRTQRKCHSAAMVIARNTAAVTLKIRVAHMDLNASYHQRTHKPVAIKATIHKRSRLNQARRSKASPRFSYTVRAIKEVKRKWPSVWVATEAASK